MPNFKGFWITPTWDLTNDQPHSREACTPLLR